MCTKICGSCQKELPATEEYFASKKLKTKVILQWQCRECHKIYRKKHYEDNKQKYIDKAHLHRDKVKNWFNQEVKQKLFCSVCKESRYWVLDFHHRDPKQKENNIAKLINEGSKKRLLFELEKCDVLCSNCHRDLHHQEKINKA